MKVVALCNKLSRSRSAKLRGDGTIEPDMTNGMSGGGDMSLGGGLGIGNQSELIGRTSPGVSNMTTGREAVEVSELN